MTQTNRNDLEARAQSARYASSAIVLLGAWVFAAPFVARFQDVPAALWTAMVVGVVLLGLELTRVREPLKRPGFSLISAVLGLWLVVFPFLYSFWGVHDAVVWSMAVPGGLVLILAIWGASETLGVR
jgi:hypothetical protein